AYLLLPSPITAGALAAASAADYSVTTNDRHFGAANIVNDKITLTQTATEFNPFELGQAVNYYEPGHDDNDVVVEWFVNGLPELDVNGDPVLRWRDPDGVIDGQLYVPRIAGLDHGGLYYVMTGVAAFYPLRD